MPPWDRIPGTPAHQPSLSSWPAPQPTPCVWEESARLPEDPGPQTRCGSGWELSMVAPRLGTQSRRLPAPRARPGSLQTPEWRDSLQAHHLRDGAAARRWLTHQKVSLKGSSHLWAALAARSRSQDLKPGCWRCAWDGRSVGPLGNGGGRRGR